MKNWQKSTSAPAGFTLLVLVLLAAVVRAQESGGVQPAGQATGQSLYEQLCASCHGANGRGDGSLFDDVLLRPRDFALGAFKFDTDADWKRGTDADLTNVIRNGTAVYGGSPLMSPWGGLSDDDISALIAHIRNLQRKGAVTRPPR